MKMKNLAGAILAFAFAAFAPGAVRADVADGAIYSVDLVEKFGGRKPTAEEPLHVGETAVIRVRLANANWSDPTRTSTPRPWKVTQKSVGSSTVYPLQLGIMLGGQEAYADYFDSEEVALPAATYTDLYFTYTVKSGDLALPTLLMDSSGKPAGEDGKPEYFLTHKDMWEIANDSGAKLIESGLFHFTAQGGAMPPVTGEPQNLTPSGRKMGLFVQTVDFDGNYVVPPEPGDEDGVWRRVYQGMTTTTTTLPSIVPEGVSEANVFMYVWVDDEAVAVPEGSKKVTDTIGATTYTRYVLPVLVAKDATVATFKLKGVANGSTRVKLSSSEHLAADDMDRLVTNWVERVIEVVDAPAPFVAFNLIDQKGDPLVAPVNCPIGEGYQDYAAALKVTLSKAPTAKVTVHLNPEIKNGGDIFGDTLLGISTTTDGTPWVNTVDEVSFEAGETEKTLYIYALGSSKNLASYGVKFTPSTTGPGAPMFADDDCTHVANLIVKYATPKIVSPTAEDKIEDAMAGQTYMLDVVLSDAYKFMREDWTYKYRIKIGGTTGEWSDDAPLLAGDELDPDSGEASVSIEFEDEGEGVLELVFVNTDKKSAKVSVPVVVSAPKKAWAELDHPGGYYAEGETAKVKFFVSQKTPGSKTYYAFLVPVEGSVDSTNKFSSTGFSTSEPATGGCPFSPGSLDSGDGFTEVTCLDGAATGQYDVFICTTLTYSKTKGAGYAAGRLVINTTNVAPHVVSAEIKDTTEVKRSGTVVAEPIALGIPKAFRVNIGDTEPSEKFDLNGELEPGGTVGGAGDNRFRTQWKFGNEDWKDVWGNPNLDTAVTNYTFKSPGEFVVKARVQDKDMRRNGNKWSDEFEFTVTVDSRPTITVTPVWEGKKTYKETEIGEENSTFRIALSSPPKFSDPDKTLVVNVTVESLGAQPGTDCVLSENRFEFYDSDRAPREFYLYDLDGTTESARRGFRITATAAGKDDEGKEWIKGSVDIKVTNEKPEILQPEEQPVDGEGKVIPTDTVSGERIQLGWLLNDVEADTNGMTVTWWTSEGQKKVYRQGDPALSTETVTNVPDVMSGTHTFWFNSSGEDLTVSVQAQDKDGGISETRTIHYRIKAQKQLSLRPHGPAATLGTSGGYSQHYGAAAGLGAGRVYAGANGPKSVLGFEQTYYFGENETSVRAYAFGYKADGKADDGSLSPGPDQAIGRDGSYLDGTPPTSFYNYSTDNVYAPKHNGVGIGLLGYDSFVYGWACNNTESSSSQSQNAQGGKTETVQSFLLNIGARGETVIPLPAKQVQSTGSLTLVNDSYPIQNWEAVFSREWKKEDNCGDINQDGVPDWAVYTFGMGVVDTSTYKLITSESGGSGEGSLSEGDLTDLKDWNKDVDKDGAEDPDYLPSTETAVFASLIPGLKESWVANGVEFGAKLEIRGYDDGLNDALGLLGSTDIATDSIYAERVETAPGVTNWVWTPNCTISALEFAAWSEFAAANGYDAGVWTNANGSLRWSPERPTKPTKSDTDGDKFNDGYEYYFWYRAHVGYMENGVHKYLTGRAYDPRNPGEGRFIDSATIARLMDPRSDLEPVDFPVNYVADPSSAETRDTDNDGLPDLLEFEIGTNPFDFDTDGDGLPDGWEIMIGGTDPLMAGSSPDATADGMRNYDGDAMAISSYALEKNQKPAAFDIEHAKFTTFAVIDPSDPTFGDTDGVQWYAVKGAPEDIFLAPATNGAAGWSFKLEGDDRDYVWYGEKLPVTADGKRLAATLEKGRGASGAYVSTKPVEVVTNGIVQVENPDNPGEMIDQDGLITNKLAGALYPIRLEAGLPVKSMLEKKVDVEIQSLASNVAAKVAFACWVYGKGPKDARYGEVAETAADYGCLALGRNLAAKKGAQVVALPADTRDVAFLHYLVYQEFGFDPRTAWCATDPVHPRWGKTTSDGQASVGVTVLKQGGYAGAPARTREYRTYDEFLVYSFFLNNGCEMSGYTTASVDAPYLGQVWMAFCTNPRGPNEPEWVNKDSYTGWTAMSLNGTNGADTDGDGVPDGWELYVMSGPKNKDGSYVFAPPYAGFAGALSGPGYPLEQSYFSPFLNFAKKQETNNQIYLGGQTNDDGLNEYREFEGTDSTGWYANAQDGNETPFSTTVVHDGEWTWFNKFFPTDPWNFDTDGDGLSDAAEKAAFAYGKPADDGKLWSIPGGGLNPCSVDTDLDGLPDPWESQFKGKTVYADDAEPKPFRAKDATGAEVGNPLEGLTDGMDGTVPDAYNVVNGDEDEGSVKTTWTIITDDGRRWSGHVNRDYDRDGLENWQEYLVGTMRCWRYDDPVSTWTAFDESVYFDEDGIFDAVRSAEILGLPGDSDEEKAATFWYETLVNSTGAFYNPHFVTGMSPAAQYFSRVTNVWDAAYLDSTLGGVDGAYYYFKDRVGGNKIADTWAKVLPLPDGSRTAPSKYICCDPTKPDTDCDGMDDYYELFHGLNPLLGQSGVKADSGNPCDIVYDAWCNTSALEAFGSGDTKNYWQRNPWKRPRGTNGMDFEVFPYLAGQQKADPDGDDIMNDQESLQTRLNQIGSHTDPTPLWMTDSSYSNSLTRLFYRMPTRANGIVPMGEGFRYNDVDYKFSQFDGWGPVGLAMGYMPFNLDSWWSVTGDDAMNWMFSFEENEGFDTDHDALSDSEERTGLYRSATDPLDADSPLRRQAMYFPGAAAALQTMPETREEYPVGAKTWPVDPSFLTFTVECWAMPEDLGRDQTVVERAIWVDPSNAGDQEYLRRNFQIAMRGGKWLAKYDSGTLTNDEVKAFSRETATVGKWTHLAMAFTGSEFRFYVDGVCQNEDSCGVTTLPEYGSSAMAFVKGGAEGSSRRPGDYGWDAKYDYKAILVGASFKGAAEGGKPEALDVTSGSGWGYYKDFFKGYVDEIRIWDGARTSKEIADDLGKRYTKADALLNRDDFYDQWSQGQMRYETATTVRVIPELRYHFHFDSVPGAADAGSVIKAPTGFDNKGGKPVLSRPENYVIDWFAKVADAYGTVYGPDRDWIQWIPNTVAHLPRFDGTTLDSFFWSADYSGANADNNAFENSAEPVSRWTQMAYNGVRNSAAYKAPAMRHHLVYEAQYAASNTTSTVVNRYKFTGRHLNQFGDDLLPLGGAFVKYADALWDGAEQGPSTQWEHTGNDTNGDGLPDWYVEFVRAKYGLAGEISPDTDVFVPEFNRTMKVRELYLIDLAQGIYLTEDGKAGTNVTGRAQSADLDKDGLPDWWEEAYRVHTKDTDLSSGHADSDPDNDGLSTYQEYLVSRGAFPYGMDNGFPNLNPMSKRSLDGIAVPAPVTTPKKSFLAAPPPLIAKQTVPDYFLPLDAFPNIKLSAEDQKKYFYLTEYLGEILTDHDFIEDWWENKYAKSYASARVYDPWDDADGDGWSTFAECRAALWGHSFMASLIDGWTGLSSDMHVTDYPEPIIGVKVAYEGQDEVSGAQLVIRTSTGQTKRMDATFVVPSTLDSQTRYLGQFEGGEVFHGHLSPGQLNPNSVVFEYARYSSDKIYQWNCDWYKANTPDDIGWDYGRIAGQYYEGWWRWSESSRIHTGDFAKYRDEIRKWPKIELEGGDLQWEAFAETQQKGDVVNVLMNGKSIGVIDATTGEFALDMTRFALYAKVDEYVFRVTYTSRIGHEWPQTVYVSDTKELASGTGLYGLGDGRVREGLNTIEAFFDFNRNGQYDVGEPYGVVRNVPVGWHKVPEVTIELADESRIAAGLRTAIASEKGSGAGEEGGSAAAQGGDAGAGAVTSSQKVRIIRESINGQTEFGELRLKERTVMSKEFVMDDRAYLTEADVLTAKKPDLDWNYLRKDAEKVGITSIDYATYRVESYRVLPDGSVSNAVIGAFTREFGTRPTAAAVSPIAELPVYSSSPTFRFTAGKDAMAFEIQVAKVDGTPVYDSGVQMLGGRSAVSLGSSAYAFTAPIYAGAPVGTSDGPVLADGETYKWRIAAFNAKWTTASDADYTEWVPFQMDVGNANRYPLQPTGYGRAGAIVRYFGPAKRTDLTNLIVVEAFANADFAGQAMAQTRVADLADLSNPTAPVNALGNVNALLTGVDTGTVYLRAYIDLNDNGQWDKFEPWGYANMFGEYGTEYVNPPNYNPKGIAVGSSAANIANPNFTVLYIEDTDWNKNEIPDCLEDITDPTIWPIPAIDPEAAFEMEDTDGGGAPDDWEEGAGTDPRDAEDEESVASAGDVMAAADVENVLLVKIGTDVGDAAAKWYAVWDRAEYAGISTGTDAALIRSLYTTWNMTGFNPAVLGTEPYVGIGRSVTFASGAAKVVNMARTTVRLVHAQVYAEFGYETGCAANCAGNGDPRLADGIAAAAHPHTMPFTVRDKYLVCRYLENIGVAGVTEAGMKARVTAAKALSPDAETWDIWKLFTLDPNTADADHDGIADSWELYTMYGVVGLEKLAGATLGTLAAAKVSPFNAADGMLVAPGEGSQLKLVEEFDGGYYPTDPWQIDTADPTSDGVIDYYAYQYHLKGQDAWKDFDLDEDGNWVGDGLSNYAEYLIDVVFGFAKCDPDKYATSDGVCDYFRKVGDLYLGEIFMDHDQVDDAWEHKYPSAANMYVYDPSRDDDEDGWSNWAESKAGTDPTRITSAGVTGANDTTTYTKNEYPIPVVTAKVVYNGNDVNLGSIVFKAWNEKSDPDMTSAPDAIWTVGNGAAKDGDGSATGAPSKETGSTEETPKKFVGRKPSGVQTYQLSGGAIKSGSITVQFLDQQFVRYDSNDVMVAHNATSPKDANWYVGVWDKEGILYDFRDRAVGTVDYGTGLLTLDCGKLTGSALALPNSTDGDSAKLIVDTHTAGNTGGLYYDTISLDNANLLIAWSAVKVSLTAEGTYYLADADAVADDAKSHGHVREGLNTFVCFADEDGNGDYTPGEPFGVVRGVDVGWQGAKFTVELAETSAISPRVDIWDSTVSDRSAVFSEYAAMPLTDRTATQEQLAALSNVVQATSAKDGTTKARLRVVRFGVNGMYAYRAGVGFNVENFIDRTFDSNGRSYLCEADFLRDGEFDIEWNTLSKEVIGKVESAVGDVTSMTYLAVVDSAEGDEPWIRGADDTNKVIRALGTTIERRFEKTKHRPVVENVEAICYGARPTFRWSLPNEESFAKKYGTSYTAFKLQVWSADGVTKIYDSGVRRAPAQDRNGVFSWTADLSAGDLTMEGKIFNTPGNYMWNVAMYNAKFQPVSDAADMFAEKGRFSIAANAQQEMNDHQYSSIDVAVKYAGPAEVIAQYADLTTLKGKVRVQAFATADFAGEPLSETVVTADVDAFASTVANARLVGLDATGTYYIRAYIDSDGDHKRSDWESWGAAKTPVVLSTALRTAPLVGVWIEDTDVDQDWLPDAWEYVKFGTIAEKTANVKSGSQTIFTTAMEESAKTRLASLSTGLEGASLTIFENGAWAKTLLGWGDDKGDITFDDIRAAVQKELDVKSGTFKITSLTVGTDGKVTLTVDAEVAPTIAGTLLTTVYGVTPGATKTVTLNVYRKANLATAGWGDPVKTKTVSLGAGEKEVVVDVGVTADDLKSGFYKIDIVE